MLDPATAPLPTSIGPYRVIRAIARGGMASVYEVEDPASSQRYALKLLTQKGLAGPRFDREYLVLSRMQHPNIVRVYRYGLAEDRRPYVLMELLDGVPAQVYAKSCGRPGTPRRTSQVIRMVRGVAEALAYLHRHGMLHRDLKSANVLVGRDGGIKLVDFGTVMLQDGSEEITRPGEFVGTHAYASPEQLEGGEMDARADIYSLGVLFYRLLTGKRPFEGETASEVLRLIHSTPLKPPGEIAAGVTPSVSALVMNMLAIEPSQRPSSADLVVEALEGLGDERDGALDMTIGLSAPEVVGRRAELAALRAVFSSARPGAMILVVGAEGAGKKRLVAQAAVDGAELGWRTLQAAFAGGAGHNPLTDAIRQAARGLQAPDKGVDYSHLATPPAENPDWYLVALHILERRIEADGRPLLLSLLDLDRARPDTLSIVRELRSLCIRRELPIAFFATAREEADRGDRPLRVSFLDARRIPVGPLSATEVVTLVGAMLGMREPPAALGRRVFEATGGLPGPVVEVVNAMVRQGLIDPVRGAGGRITWRDRSGGRVVIPTHLREQLNLRMDDLSEAALRMAQALAVWGAPAPLSLLGDALGMDPRHRKAAAWELAEQGLIDELPDPAGPQIAFRVGLFSLFLREGLRAAERTRLHEGLARALPADSPGPAQVKLLLAANQLERAVDMALRWVASNPTAEAWPLLDRLAARLSEEVGVPAVDRARLYLAHARLGADVDGAEPRVDRSLLEAAGLAADALMPEVHLERASAALRRGNTAQAHAALSSLPDPLPEGLRAREALVRGRLTALEGAPDQAVLWFQSAIEAALPDDGPDLRGEAWLGLGAARFAQGELPLAEVALLRGRGTFAEAGATRGSGAAYALLIEVLRAEGRFSEALKLSAQGLELARASGNPAVHASLLLATSLVRVDLYQPGEARELIAEAMAVDSSRSSLSLQVELFLARARLFLACSQWQETIELLERPPAALAAGLPERSLIDALLGEALCRAGQRERGEAILDAAIVALSQRGHRPWLAEACVRRASIADEDEVEHLLDPVAAWLEEGPARPLRVAAALARGRAAQRGGSAGTARALFRDALAEVEEMYRSLEATDRAALRVHPWRREIDRGLLAI